ncbi:hypothetical protein QBC46DRAFT_342930 [Diplogelasinospora grovesii]|uniref:Uncharacterized protein n=1 Tax=Diplogelasinospora grovesii TaxID=303347 RepID=A0AAN6N5M7_9PEZI|nr:hypothetical protein QBC46DRAFT_342930 [Diplogelasinospora grovesii]
MSYTNTLPTPVSGMFDPARIEDMDENSPFSIDSQAELALYKRLAEGKNPIEVFAAARAWRQKAPAEQQREGTAYQRWWLALEWRAIGEDKQFFASKKGWEVDRKRWVKQKDELEAREAASRLEAMRKKEKEPSLRESELIQREQQVAQKEEDLSWREEQFENYCAQRESDFARRDEELAARERQLSSGNQPGYEDDNLLD